MNTSTRFKKGQKALNKGLPAPWAKKNKLPKIPWNKGMKMSDSFREKCRKRQLGKKPSDETRARMSVSQSKPHVISKDGMRNIKKSRSGANSHWWQGGKTNETMRIRNSVEYRTWRKAVFERDGYMCVIGGASHGHKLEADHIKQFAHFPDLRLLVENGRTLCKMCHRKTETFGSRRITKAPPTELYDGK